MPYKNMIAISLALCSSFTNLRAAGQADFSSGAIKTDYGFLLVWNAPNNHYTLEIRGGEVRQTSAERVFFSVDKVFLQILTTATDEFIKKTNRKADDKTILKAHMDWETKFKEGEYGKKLEVESSWQKLSNGKDALAWGLTVPKSPSGNVTKQLSLTLVKGDFVLTLGGVVSDTITETATTQLLLRTAETLKTSDQPIDLQKLQDAIRNGVPIPTGDPIDHSRTATIKGKVFKSDTNEPIPNAIVLLMNDNKSATPESRIETRTDAQGNYTLPNVPAGTYTVSLRAWYKAQEDAPCKLLLGKTADKNSSVMVLSEQGKAGVVEQVLIKGFSVKAGKDISKDFDFACKSMFGS